MKRITTMLALVALLLPLHEAAAQVPVEPATPLVNEHIADTYTQRSATWWRLLNKQLLGSLDKPAEAIDQTALQNVIYFATHHADKLRLDRTVPTLIDIYREHTDERYRMLALSALHAVGDEEGMAQLYRLSDDEASDRLRRMTVAVLNDYYAH